MFELVGAGSFDSIADILGFGEGFGEGASTIEVLVDLEATLFLIVILTISDEF